jgi:hypothetical protein
VHRGARSILYLSLEAKVFRKMLLSGQLIDISSQFASELPGLDVFGILNLHLTLFKSTYSLNPERGTLNGEP